MAMKISSMTCFLRIVLTYLRIQKSNEEVRKNVVDYVAEYNKTGQYNYILTYTDSPGGFLILANDSLDITNDILNGLNAQYRAKKEAEKGKK